MTNIVQFPGSERADGEISYPPKGAIEMASRLKHEFETLQAEMTELRHHCPDNVWRGMEISCGHLEGALDLLLSAFSKAGPAAVQPSCVDSGGQSLPAV